MTKSFKFVPVYSISNATLLLSNLLTIGLALYQRWNASTFLWVLLLQIIILQIFFFLKSKNAAFITRELQEYREYLRRRAAAYPEMGGDTVPKTIEQYKRNATFAIIFLDFFLAFVLWMLIGGSLLQGQAWVGGGSSFFGQPPNLYSVLLGGGMFFASTLYSYLSNPQSKQISSRRFYQKSLPPILVFFSGFGGYPFVAMILIMTISTIFDIELKYADDKETR